jgi:uncharacterized protein YbjT (DUF2867 family)
MSEARTVVLIGASGLVGTRVLDEALGRADMRVVALGRREFRLPMGGRSQLVICDPARWGEAIEDIGPDCVACAVGTTWQKAGENEDEFRAVDQELVLATARAAKDANVPQWVAVSAAGANRHLRGDPYLQVKGEVEDALIKLKFRRLDILRPGLLRGPRGSDRGIGERLGVVASPVIDLLRQGGQAEKRSIAAREVARGILQLAREKAAGRFIHDNEAIHRAARRLPPLEDEE